MSQAKSFTDVELDQVLRYVSSTRYHHRNRAMILMSFLSGMRVGEIAALTIADVSNEDGTVKSEIRLSPKQTKGHNGRTVFVCEKLRHELAQFLKHRSVANPQQPLFYTEKSNFLQGAFMNIISLLLLLLSFMHLVASGFNPFIYFRF